MGRRVCAVQVFCAAKPWRRANSFRPNKMKTGLPSDGASDGKSAGTQAEDALEMKRIYQQALAGP